MSKCAFERKDVFKSDKRGSVCELITAMYSHLFWIVVNFTNQAWALEFSIEALIQPPGRNSILLDHRYYLFVYDFGLFTRVNLWSLWSRRMNVPVCPWRLVSLKMHGSFISELPHPFPPFSSLSLPRTTAEVHFTITYLYWKMINILIRVTIKHLVVFFVILPINKAKGDVINNTKHK